MPDADATTGAAPASALDSDNPFAAPSGLEHELPPFDRIREEHYLPAFEAGMAEQVAEVAAITAGDDVPTFSDTIEALERSGELLERVSAVFSNLTATDSTEGLRRLQAELAPRLAAHRDAILLDRRLFERVEAVHATRHDGGLDAEQVRLVERYRTDFVRAGAGLSPTDQDRLRRLNGELSELTTRFGTELLVETNESAVHVLDRARLDGLSDDAVSAAEQAARARGLDGYLLTLGLSTAQPVLASLRDRGLREQVHRASVERGARGGEHDTREVLVRIAALRAERAGLLGHRDHASWVVADQTAGSVDAVTELLHRLVPPAVANAHTEAVRLEEALVADGLEAPLQPWDWAYYAERVKADTYQVDAAALRPYLPLDRVVRDGVMRAATALYGLTFTRREDLTGYHPDVEVHEVHDEAGDSRGLLLADWYSRDSKRGGAWMSSFVTQSRLTGRRPVVVLNLNVPRPAGGEPALLTADEVRTAFHEFGHVLHGLLSDVTYPRLSMTSVPRDFVEYPSQVNEMWAWWPQVLAGYAAHHRTGEPLSQEVVDRLEASRAFGQGFATTEYLAAAVIDLEWHLLPVDGAPVAPQEVATFEQAVLEKWGLTVAAVPPRYRSTYFAHSFTNGYDAGYYSYIWSEVLDADTVDWFTENGGLRRENGEVFARELLSRGGSVDPIAAFEAVRGRPKDVAPLLRRRDLDGA
ncbi:M3 family metallopeptidase [Thalassiella azotivora]